MAVELGFQPAAVGLSLTDSIHAAATSSKLGRDWLSRYIGQIGRGEELATELANRAVRSRFETIAITEANAAFAEERIRQAQLALGDRYDLIEIWDATLDKRTCRECWDLNGTRVLTSVGFPGGARPGSVHPRCRCSSDFEFVLRGSFRMAA